MAKAKLPLLGVQARGQLGKAIVYFPWKGIQCVRTHVYPAQPRTGPQLAVRADFSNHIDAWHAITNLAADKVAWNLFASVSKRAASGFNEFVGFCRAQLKGGDTLAYLNSLLVTVNASGTVTGTFKSTEDGARNITVYWGYSKTFMPSMVTATRTSANLWGWSITGVTTEVDIYVTVVELATDHQGRTGIYKIAVLA